MPLYDYVCPACGWAGEGVVPINMRDNVFCTPCSVRMERQVAAPLGRIAGKPVQGGGADRFTADMLGIPLKELPDGLREDKGVRKA